MLTLDDMKHQNKNLKDMNEEQLIWWIRLSPIGGGITENVRDRIVDGLKHKSQNGEGVKGEDFFDAEEAGDISDLVGIGSTQAAALWERIKTKKQTDLAKNIPDFKDMKEQEQVIEWIQTLSINEKQQIIQGITDYSEEITGIDLSEADVQDIKDYTGLSGAKAKKFLDRIYAKKQADYIVHAPTDDPVDDNDDSNLTQNSQEILKFDLKIVSTKMYIIKDVNKNWTIARCKSKFAEEIGDLSKRDLYADHAKYKWASKDEKGIVFKKNSKELDDDKTLGYYGIVNGISLPIQVTFKVIGGSAESKYYQQDEDKDEDEDKDKYRVRRLNRKKLRGSGIKFTNKPDCIMGYTDEDGIKRAEMSCGCAFAADTMYRYMKSLFEKDIKTVKPKCPIPISQCKGNNKEREWDWGIIFAVADLSDEEIATFTKAISNRVSSTKNCPNCGAVTSRPENIKISRVSCTVCNGRDWCWNCTKKWKTPGLGPICGNNGCMAETLTEILKPENCGVIDTPTRLYWENKNDGAKIPKSRACPKCLTLMEFVKECKEIKCIGCPHRFCFNCLGTWKSGWEFASNECGHAKYCTPAAPQTFS